jgi:hypothetical protein
MHILILLLDAEDFVFEFQHLDLLLFDLQLLEFGLLVEILIEIETVLPLLLLLGEDLVHLLSQLQDLLLQFDVLLDQFWPVHLSGPLWLGRGLEVGKILRVALSGEFLDDFYFRFCNFDVFIICEV